MDVFEAVASRYSCRAFLPTPVPEKIVRDIVERAARAPSAGNMQPWRIYAIASKRVEELKALLAPRMASELPKGEGTDHAIYPEPLTEPYRTRRLNIGELLCESIPILREDELARYKQYARNYQFFGAPAALFFAREKLAWAGAMGRHRRLPADGLSLWRAAMACTPARNRPGCRFIGPCAAF